MLYRILVTVATALCTFTHVLIVHADIQTSQQLVQIKDIVCVLILGGLNKEDLDSNTLKKLKQHNININQMTTEELREDCITGKSFQTADMIKPIDIPNTNISTTSNQSYILNQDFDLKRDQQSNNVKPQTNNKEKESENNITTTNFSQYLWNITNSELMLSLNEKEVKDKQQSVSNGTFESIKSNGKSEKYTIKSQTTQVENISDLYKATTATSINTIEKESEKEKLNKILEILSQKELKIVNTTPVPQLLTMTPEVRQSTPQNDIITKLLAQQYILNHQSLRFLKHTTTEVPQLQIADILSMLNSYLEKESLATNNIKKKYMMTTGKPKDTMDFETKQLVAQISTINISEQSTLDYNNDMITIYNDSTFDKKSYITNKEMAVDNPFCNNLNSDIVKQMNQVITRKPKDSNYLLNESKEFNEKAERVKPVQQPLVTLSKDTIQNIVDRVKNTIMTDLKHHFSKDTTTENITPKAMPNVKENDTILMHEFLNLFKLYKNEKSTSSENVKQIMEQKSKGNNLTENSTMSPNNEILVPTQVPRIQITTSPTTTPEITATTNAPLKIFLPVKRISEISNRARSPIISLIQTNLNEVPPLYGKSKSRFFIDQMNIIVTSTLRTGRRSQISHYWNSPTKYSPKSSYAHKHHFDSNQYNEYPKFKSGGRLRDVVLPYMSQEHKEATHEIEDMYKNYEYRPDVKVLDNDYNGRKSNLDKAIESRRVSQWNIVRNQEHNRDNNPYTNPEHYENKMESAEHPLETMQGDTSAHIKRVISDIDKEIEVRSNMQQINQREQQPLEKTYRSSTYDDKHFKNFLKTQQEVNDILETMLSLKPLHAQIPSVEAM